MDGYYVVGVIAIPYLGFGVIINIASNKDITYVHTSSQSAISRIACVQTSQKCPLKHWERNENGCTATSLLCVLIFVQGGL